MATFDMKHYARRGAESRIGELNEELEAIYGAFPELRQSSRGRPAGKVVVNHEEQFTRTRGDAKARSGAATPRATRRGNMTVAQRKAVSERMRKYWAARKNAEK